MVKVKEEIDKLLRVDFIGLVKQVTLLNLILVVPIKNGNIRVCVDYRKFNTITITDDFPLPFTDGVLEVIGRHKMYCFLDGFNGYNHIPMHPDEIRKRPLS